MSAQPTAMTVGSIAHASVQSGKSLAASFLHCDYMILFDSSGSMGLYDAPGNQRRYDCALTELAKLQHQLPGKLAIVAFSSVPVFVPGGVPPFLSGDTNLAAALSFVRVCDGLIKSFIVISDGLPDDSAACLQQAQAFKTKISTIYVGPEDEHGGQDFLRRLATVSGGKYDTAVRVEALADKLQPMLAE